MAKLPNQTLLEHNLMQVLAENCTGMDDHDDEDCNKCADMEDALVKAVAQWYGIVAGEDELVRLRQQLQRISFAAGNIGIEHPEWPNGYSEHLVAVVDRAEKAERENASLRSSLDRYKLALETIAGGWDGPTKAVAEAALRGESK